MKKLYLLIFSFIFIFSCGCQDKQELLPLDNSSVQPNLNFDLKTEKQVYSSDETVINCFVNYYGTDEATYGGDYVELHKFDGGKWKKVAYKDDEVAFLDYAVIIKPNTTNQEKIDLDNYFDLPLSKGKYQLKVDFLISNTFEIE